MGSVKIKIALPLRLADQLFWAVKRGEFSHLNVIDTEFIGRAAAQAIVREKMERSDYDVFLCYNNKDKKDVKRVGKKLKEFGILPWFDEWELRPGVSWQKSLESQIMSIKSAAVFIGNDGIGPWQDVELNAFLRQFVKRGCPIIPAILKRCNSAPQLPIFLEGMGWVNFRKKKPDPIEQLIWGITGRRVDKTIQNV